jgi:phosphatidylglycerophosphatase A
MAGTYGSFFSIPLCVAAVLCTRAAEHAAIFPGQKWTMTACILAVFLLGIWAIPIAEQALGPRRDWHGRIKNQDQNQIVIDETFGMLISCWPLQWSDSEPAWWQFGLAFVLFRIFDVIKVPPTGYFDRQKSAAGVMLDDAIAGIYAGGTLVFITILLS